MEIIEQFIKGKTIDDSLCEDALLVNENFIVVADGVTAKTNAVFQGKTGGKAAAEKVCEAVSGFSSDISVFEAVNTLTQFVADLYTDDKPLGSAAASVIIFSKYRNEIWSIGDCQCYINNEFFSHEKEIDAIVSSMRSLIIDLARREGMSDSEIAENDVGREFLLPVMKKLQIFANSQGKFSYGVINGTKVNEKDIVVHKVKPGDEIVLASDGYPVLLRTLAQSEKRLAEEIKRNPLCCDGFRSTKGIKKDCISFDDRTYIRFRV